MNNKPQVNDFKWVQIYRNGDTHSPPVRFFVSNKYHKTFECLLNSLTIRLNPTFGAIRRLYTLQGKQISHIDELQANQKYVAAGYEKFRRTSYENLRGLSWKRRHRPLSLCEIRPVIHSRIKVASRYKLAIENSVALTIFVYRNGDDITPAHVVTLSKKDMLNWDLILKRISERVLPSGFVRKLYNLNGQSLSHYSELENGESYVAVAGYEGFRNVAYGMLAPPVTRKFSPWRHGISQGSSIQDSKSYEFRRSLSTSSAATSPDSGRSQLHLLNEREKQKGIFTVKDGRKSHPGRIRQIDYDEDNSGVYRARAHSKEAVKEINDSEETSIELPLDARDAEEVKDEEIMPKLPRVRMELNSNTVIHLDTMSASEPSLEVDFDGSNQSDSTFVKEKELKKSMSEEKDYSGGRERKHSGGRLKRSNISREIADSDDNRSNEWTKNKKNFQNVKNSDLDSASLQYAKEEKNEKESDIPNLLIQYKGDFVGNSGTLSDNSKKEQPQNVFKLPVLSARLRQENEGSLSQTMSSPPSETSGTIEKPFCRIPHTNHAKNTGRNNKLNTILASMKTPREIDTSTVSYSPKSTSSVPEDDETNFLTSRFSVMSISGQTMAETDISDITSREDFALMPDFSEYTTTEFQSALTVKGSSSSTDEFSKQEMPFKLNTCSSYVDEQSMDFSFPHVTEEYATDIKNSTSNLSLTLNSEGGSQTINSDSTYLSNRSATSQSENTNSTECVSNDESQYNLEEQKISSTKYNIKFNNKIRSNVFSIPHVL